MHKTIPVLLILIFTLISLFYKGSDAMTAKEFIEQNLRAISSADSK